MAPGTLSKLLKKKGPLAAILTNLPGLDGLVSITDLDGKTLFGANPQPQADRAAILLEEQPIGWVAPAALASLLSYAAAQEVEKKSLAAELLDRYRELNLLYHLSEILGASPYPEAIAHAALMETIRILPAQTALILLKADGKEKLQTTSEWGSSYQLVPGCPLVMRVLASGIAELDNAAAGETFFLETANQRISVLCAPLKTEKNILGVILLAGPPGRAFTAGDLKLLNSIAQQTAPVIEVTRLHQIELEKARFEQEMQLARQVQESLLPQRVPEIPGWQFGRHWQPAHDLSGDFYDVIEEDLQHLGLVIADVTDKGMPASLFMVFVRSALRASITPGTSPAQALINANRVICQDSYEGLFATLFYARLNISSGAVDYVNAGHPPALFYRSAQNDLQQLARTGMVLGVDIQSSYTHQSVQLDPADFILFYTDGVIEAVNPAGEEFGLERLKSEVFSRRSCSVAELLDGLDQTLSAYIYPLPVEDDVTLMMVRRG